MSRDFNAEIEEQLELLQPIERAMDEQKEAFIRELTNYVRDWYWRQTEELVKRYPEITKGLGKDRLGQLKSEVRELQSRAEETVRKSLDRDSLWWHLRENRLGSVSLNSYQPAEYYSYKTDNREHMPDVFSDGLGAIGGTLGSILEPYGYIASRGESYRSGSGKEVWRKSDSSYYEGHYKELFTSYNWPEELKPPIKRYDELNKQAIEVAQNILKIKSAQARNEADDLWDSA